MAVEEKISDLHFCHNKDLNVSKLTPTKSKFQAKVCQDNSKALMTNPNKDLADWLLRTALQLGVIYIYEKGRFRAKPPLPI